MTLKRVLLLLPLLALALGCVDTGMFANQRPPTEDDYKISFGYRGYSLNKPIEAGEWGQLVWIRGVPEFSPLPRSKAILNGPGGLYYVTWDKDSSTGLYTQKETPWEEIADTYYSNGMYLYYRPPSNEEVPPEGVDVTFACEVLNPISGKWERSPDYTRRVARRDGPMDFYLGSFDPNVPLGVYGPDSSFSEATLVSGDTFDRLALYTKPMPVDDIRLQVGLSGPDGYSGHLGTLEMYYKEKTYGQPTERGYRYTAPADLTEPVDITARFSILDPWTKETRTRVLTFHVVPKGKGN